MRRLDPSAMRDKSRLETPRPAVEIAWREGGGNSEAFKLLSVYSGIDPEEDNKTKLSQLWIWASTETTPSNEFEQLLQTIPLDEVTYK